MKVKSLALPPYYLLQQTVNIQPLSKEPQC